MKGFKKWSPLCLPVALIVGLIAGWMVVQQVGVTPSEAQVGPGSQPPGPPMQGSPPKLPPKLPASPTPPPEEQEMGPPPDQTPRKRPTLRELLERVRNMPGGPEMIEEAKRRGARIGMKSDEPGTSLSWLNPFKVKVAEALEPFELLLDPSNKWYSSSPYGYAVFRGLIFGVSYPVTTSPRLHACNLALGTQIIQPSLAFTFDAPADGWYAVNMEAGGANVTLKHYEGGSYSTVQTWSYSGIPGTVPYTSLVELAAGRHYFYWVSASSVYVYWTGTYSL